MGLGCVCVSGHTGVYACMRVGDYFHVPLYWCVGECAHELEHTGVNVDAGRLQASLCAWTCG